MPSFMILRCSVNRGVRCTAALAAASWLMFASAAIGADRAPAAEDRLPEGLSASDWSSIRAAYEANRHAAYRVDGGYQARNPGQQWRTHFDGRGFETTPDGGGWSWGLELVSYGREGAERAVGSVAPAHSRCGQRVEYEWDAALIEWYINDTRGMEHGYTVQKNQNVETSKWEFAIHAGGARQPAAANQRRRTECGVRQRHRRGGGELQRPDGLRRDGGGGNSGGNSGRGGHGIVVIIPIKDITNDMSLSINGALRNNDDITIFTRGSLADFPGNHLYYSVGSGFAPGPYNIFHSSIDFDAPIDQIQHTSHLPKSFGGSDLGCIKVDTSQNKIFFVDNATLYYVDLMGLSDAFVKDGFISSIDLDRKNHKIYFVTGENENQISICDYDGSNTQSIFVGPDILQSFTNISLDFNNNKIYFGLSSGIVSLVGSVGFDGENYVQISGINSRSMQFDHNQNTLFVNTGFGIRKINVVDNSITTLIANDFSRQLVGIGLSVTNNHLYFCDNRVSSRGIYRINYDGSNETKIISVPSSMAELESVAAGKGSSIGLFILNTDDESNDIDLYIENESVTSLFGSIQFNINGMVYNENYINLGLSSFDSIDNTTNTVVVGKNFVSDYVSLCVNAQEDIHNNITSLIYGCEIKDSNLDFFIHGFDVIQNNLQCVVNGHQTDYKDISLHIVSFDYQEDSIALSLMGSDDFF